jgi:hypothetical protein
LNVRTWSPLYPAFSPAAGEKVANGRKREAFHPISQQLSRIVTFQEERGCVRNTTRSRWKRQTQFNALGPPLDRRMNCGWSAIQPRSAEYTHGRNTRLELFLIHTFHPFNAVIAGDGNRFGR